MTAFEQWWETHTHTARESYRTACKAAFEAALQHAAKICEEKYAHYDGSKYDCYLNADECAEAIRKEISK